MAVDSAAVLLGAATVVVTGVVAGASPLTRSREVILLAPDLPEGSVQPQ